MPKASEPNAPWVAVCELLRTATVMPCWASPSRSDDVHNALLVGLEAEGDAELAVLFKLGHLRGSDGSSTMGRDRGVVGVEWSVVAKARSGGGL